MRSVWFGFVAAAVACGNGAADRHPAMPAEGGDSTGGTRARPTTTGGSRSHSAGAAGQDENAGGTTASNGGSGDGGSDEIIYEMAGAPTQPAPGVCDAQMMLGADQAQDLGVASATLLSMTADELSVAFTTGADATLALHVADRASADADFVEAGFTLPDGFEAKSGAALSSNGLTLILVLEDHSGFGQLSRSTRGAAFQGDGDVTAFAKINGLKAMSGRSVGWPVLTSDGLGLYYLSYFGNALAVQSKRSQGGVFDIGTEIDEFTLGGASGAYKLLSGISTDERAIFYFDQSTGHSMARFRSRPGAPFYDPLDLGARHGAAPNQDCSRVYSSVASGLVLQASP
jgi:hypothetical protein